MDSTIELGKLWDRVLARRRAIVALVVATTLVTAVVAFLLPPWYRAEASIMPPGEDISFGLGNLLKGIGVPGVKVPTQATPAEVFKAILESRMVNEEIVRRFDLRRLYRKRFMVDAIRELRRYARFGVDDVGVIVISVEDRDPKRAADMANAYFEVLDHFNRESRMTRGRRVRMFVGARLDSTRHELTLAEQRLTSYEATHKAVALSPEASTAIEAAAHNYANRTALEVRLGMVRSYSRETSDEERQILLQLAQLDRQLATLPDVGMGLARLVRDVQTEEQLFLLLTAQYEDARITETRDVATLERLDVATPPERKARPRRGQMIAIAFLFSLTAGVVIATLQDERETNQGEAPTRG